MSFTSSFAHLDGVEFRISDSLQVAPISQLPPNFQIRDPTKLLLESEYDFSKERQTLWWIEAKKKSEKKIAEQEEARRQLSLKRRSEEKLRKEMLEQQQRELLAKQREIFLEQKRRQQEKENGRQTPDGREDAGSRSSPTSDSSDEPPPLPPKNPFTQIGSTSILTPLPVAENNKDPAIPGIITSTSSQAFPNPSQPAVSGSNQIWVDFEDKELDPFTNMELKTIDTLKELQSVLQNAKIGADVNTSPEDPTTSKTSETNRANDENVYENIRKAENERSSDDHGDKSAMLSSSNPFCAEIPPDFKTSVERETPSGGSSKSLSPDSSKDINPSYENVKTLMRDNEPDSPKFELPKFDKKGENELYENVKIVTVGNDTIRFEKCEKEEQKVGQSSPDPPLYEFANEPHPKMRAKEPTVPTTLYQNLKEMDPIPQNQADDISATYSTVRPRTRAAKSPDQKNPVLTGSASSNWPRPEQSGTKVLPVSFGVVPSSLSTTVLPPIPTSNIITASNYVNITPKSMSDVNVAPKPAVPPRKPPVPPRDPIAGPSNWPPKPSWGQMNTQVAPVLTHSGSPSVGSSPTGAPTPNGLPPPGTTHHHPPYALPVTQPLNGPNVLSYSKPATVSQPNPPPRKGSLPVSKTDPKPPDITFIKKSREDRAKFEETMNRALSSLPKSPVIKPVVTHKPTTPPSQRKVTNQRAHNKTPSLLQALPPSEREFVNSITSMGFDLEATIRAMQMCGQDAKEVVDHLCTVQRISDLGFSTKRVQDALEVYKEDHKQVTIYLQLSQQLIDMGFAENDVKQALLSNNNDQAKALDQLMGQS